MRTLPIVAFLLLLLPGAALPGDAEDARALLKNLAKAAAKTPVVPAERNGATSAILRFGDQAAMDAEWRKAVREKGPGLSDDERAALWGQLVYMDANRKRQALLAEELEAFHSAFPKHPAFAAGLSTVLDWEYMRGNPDNLPVFLAAYGDKLPEKERKRWADRLAAFHAGAAAPPLAGKTWNGEGVDLAALKGRPVLLYYWASG